MISTILYENDLKSYDFCTYINMHINVKDAAVLGISYRVTNLMYMNIYCLKIHCDKKIHDKKFISDEIIPKIFKKLNIDNLNFKIISNMYNVIYVKLEENIFNNIKNACSDYEWNYSIRDTIIKNNIISFYSPIHHKKGYLLKILRDLEKFVDVVFIDSVINDGSYNISDDNDITILFNRIENVSN